MELTIDKWAVIITCIALVCIALFDAIRSYRKENTLKKSIEENLKDKYDLLFSSWKNEHSKTIRAEAINKSKEVIQGQVLETMLPLFITGNTKARENLLKELGVISIDDIHPSDFRFLGSPIDFVYFKGLNSGNLEQIIFIEIKTKKGSLPKREKQIRDLIVNDNLSNINWKMITLEDLRA